MKHRIKDFACTVASMLERGERVVLECVDIKGAERIEEISGYREGIMTSEIVVHSIGRDGELIIGDDSDEDLFIAEEEFKYFKIKESEYTFNDLIDVAVQAYKDGYIRLMRLDNDVLDISYNIDGDGLCGFLTSKTEESGYQFGQYIRDINSLYTETFVIESEEDVLNVKDEAEILFLNGEKAIFADSTRDGHYGFVLISNVIHKIPLPLLKGATVTQKRGDS